MNDLRPPPQSICYYQQMQKNGGILLEQKIVVTAGLVYPYLGVEVTLADVKLGPLEMTHKIERINFPINGKYKVQRRSIDSLKMLISALHVKPIELIDKQPDVVRAAAYARLLMSQSLNGGCLGRKQEPRVINVNKTMVKGYPRYTFEVTNQVVDRDSFMDLTNVYPNIRSKMQFSASNKENMIDYADCQQLFLWFDKDLKDAGDSIDARVLKYTLGITNNSDLLRRLYDVKFSFVDCFDDSHPIEEPEKAFPAGIVDFNGPYGAAAVSTLIAKHSPRPDIADINRVREEGLLPWAAFDGKYHSPYEFDEQGNKMRSDNYDE